MKAPKRFPQHCGFDWVEMLPWSLRSMADAPNLGAKEKSAIPVGMTEPEKEKPWSTG